jgi:protein phosphatase
MTTAGNHESKGSSPHCTRAAAMTDIGKFRDHNEDAFLVRPELDLYAVSDGMGGHAGGEIASRIVVEALPEMLADRLAADLTTEQRHEVLRSTLLELSCRVREEADRRVGLTGMGATVVAAALDAGAAAIAHMGDSRAYRYSAGVLTQITEDHSVVGILLRRGEITPDEVRDHPARGRITRFIGMDDGVDPDVTTVGLAPGERLLLCSDGLTGAVSDEEIASVLTATVGDPDAACRRLVEAACAGDATDNITVLVIDRIPSVGAEHESTTTAEE